MVCVPFLPARAFRPDGRLGCLFFGGDDDASKAAEEAAKEREEELQKQYEEQLEEYKEAMSHMAEIEMPTFDSNNQQLKRIKRKSPEAAAVTAPATVTNQSEIDAAQQQSLLDAKRRRGLLATIQAGETGNLLTSTLGNTSTLG